MFGLCNGGQDGVGKCHLESHEGKETSFLRV